MNEPFWWEEVARLEWQGIPYPGKRSKWWYSCRFGWFFTTLAEFSLDLERTLAKNRELYERLAK
jgi:hypothetical protein